MLRKSVETGGVIWHRQFGRAIFVNWYDEEKNLCRVQFANRKGVFIFNRSELHNTANKIRDIKPGWYKPDSIRQTHFFSPINNGNYGSACGKLKLPGGALTPESDLAERIGDVVDLSSRCGACQKATKNGMKTTLFDFDEKC